MQYFVYGLYVTGENKPFYIGKSNTNHTAQKRFVMHIHAAKSGIKYFVYDKIRKLLNDNTPFCERRLKYFDNEQEAFDLEIKLINLLGKIIDKTGCLFNITNGGDGVRGRNCSEETKQKISQANLGQRRSTEVKQKLSVTHKGKQIWWKGRKHTEETKQKIREAACGYKHNEDAITKLKQINRTKCGWTEEQTKEIITLYNKGYSSNFIGKKFNISGNAVIHRLKAFNVKIRSFSEARKLLFKDKELA